MPERHDEANAPPVTHGSAVTPLIIRPVAPEDAEEIAAIYAPYVRDTAISFELVPPTGEDMRERIRSMAASYPWLVCTEGQSVRGYAYASRHRERAAYRWAVDVSVYIRAAAHRRGIGRALYSALLRLVAAQGFCTAYAGITLPNAASVGLHEALGFQPIGVYRAVGHKLGAWRDVGWWDLVLQTRPAKPAEPRPLAALRGTPEWNAAIAAGQALLRA